MVLQRKSGQVTVPISEFPCNYLCNYLKSLGLSLSTSKMLELDVRVCICNPSQRRLGHEDQCEFRASLGYMGFQASLHMHPIQPSFHPIYFFLPLFLILSLPLSLSLSLSLTHTHTHTHHWYRSTLLSLWVVKILGVNDPSGSQASHRVAYQTSYISVIYIMIHSSSNITVMKWQQNIVWWGWSA